MDFEWDDAKSARNFRERGLSFDDAAMVFLGPTVEILDERRPYGEVRIKAIGVVETEFLVVVFTDRRLYRSSPCAPHHLGAQRARRTERNASYGGRS